LGKCSKIGRSDNVDYQKVVNDLGGIYTSAAVWVNVPKMLEILRDFFKNKESYQAQKIDNCQLQISENSIVYKAFQAKRIIFCEGYYSLQNPLFNWIPFNPAKGETLLADVESYNISEIVNQGFWIIPLGNDKCRFGSTYIWVRLYWEPSESSKELISSKISKFLTLPYKITGQEAGIRPTTKDRRPFIGNHPLHKNVYIFNGLGTKGVSLAPYFAEKMLDFLESDKVLISEANI